MVRAFAILPLALVACRALNPAFEDGGSGAASDAPTSETSDDGTTTSTGGEASLSGTSSPSATSASTTMSGGPSTVGDTTWGAESSSSGDEPPPACPEPPRFNITYEYACESEGRFVEVNACTHRSYTKDGDGQAIAIRDGFGCELDGFVCTNGATAPPTTLMVDGFSLPEALLETDLQCGPMVLTGMGANGRCQVDGVFLFDQAPSHALLLGFANFSDTNTPFVQQIDEEIPFSTPLEQPLTCGPGPLTCGEAGWLDVEFGSAVVSANRSPAISTIDIEDAEATQDVVVFNYDLMRDPGCRTRGAWAVSHSELAHLFPNSPG